MKTTCIDHLPKMKMIILKEDFLKICDENKAAALLLGLFEYWHNIKLEQQYKNIKYNDIAEMHGDGRTQDEKLYQFHTARELYDNLMGLVGKEAIEKGILLLKDKKFIIINKNPNPRYHFDKTRYFLLQTNIINISLKKLTGILNQPDANDQISITVEPNQYHGNAESGIAITKTTSKTTSKILDSESQVPHTSITGEEVEEKFVQKEEGHAADPVNVVMGEFHKFNPAVGFGNKTERAAVEWLIEACKGVDTAKAAVVYANKVIGEDFAPQIFTPFEMKNKFAKLKAYKNKEKPKNTWNSTRVL